LLRLVERRGTLLTRQTVRICGGATASCIFVHTASRHSRCVRQWGSTVWHVARQGYGAGHDPELHGPAPRLHAIHNIKSSLQPAVRATTHSSILLTLPTLPLPCMPHIPHRPVPSIQSFTSNLPLVGSVMPLTQARSLGLSYHLADVWLPELRKAAGEGSLRQEALQALLEPFVGVLQQSGEAALINRVRWVLAWCVGWVGCCWGLGSGCRVQGAGCRGFAMP
jgi:hypothetical protein